jgi:2-polyprenyl-3-methyl-5-hydroxy-6-metoxy-1,4-benzoquinol methylase
LTREVAEFVLAELPSPPALVLEVGCGAGELARLLAGVGYDVLAIDPDAPGGPMFRQTPIEALDEAGPFDAVVASRSLHHVADLPAALDKIAAILRSGGVLVLDEFAWERLDERSAGEVGIRLAEWREEHDDLHTSAAMLAEVGTRFEQRALSWQPYLYREARQSVDRETELELIRAGRIGALGFHYVGICMAPGL